jgi:hypothetical protein
MRIRIRQRAVPGCSCPHTERGHRVAGGLRCHAGIVVGDLLRRDAVLHQLRDRIERDAGAIDHRLPSLRLGVHTDVLFGPQKVRDHDSGAGRELLEDVGHGRDDPLTGVLDEVRCVVVVVVAHKDDGVALSHQGVAGQVLELTESLQCGQRLADLLQRYVLPEDRERA